MPHRTDRNHRRFRILPGGESLETRNLLASHLIAHWVADDLQLDDQSLVEGWIDRVRGKVALRSGQPKWISNRLNGHSAVRFNAADGPDRMQLQLADDPLQGAESFSIVVVFASRSDELFGDQGEWYLNSGIVDANGFGLNEDWGVSINRAGAVSAGVGRPARTIYSDVGFHDGIAHVIVANKRGSTLSLNIDGQSYQRDDVSAAPRTPRTVRFGSGGNPFTGEIAEIRFYDDTLSVQQTTDLISNLQNQYVNLPPAAIEDRYAIEEDTTLAVSAKNGVLQNDFDPEGDAFRATMTKAPGNGTVTLESNGAFAYEPDADFNGVDHFVYRIENASGWDSANVEIHVAPTYDPIQAQPDSYLVVSGKSITVPAQSGVLTNDKNPDGAEFSAQLRSNVANGNLSFHDDGGFTYRSNPAFHGQISFEYSTLDAANNIQSSFATIRVQPKPVIISEFAASNRLTRNDSDGESSDWIEIWNFGDEELDMENWFLTDSQRNLSKWEFPKLRLPAQGRTLVFASGKDRKDAAELHTNFKLSSAGEYLALVARDGRTIISEFAPNYPFQIRDFSYGVLPAAQADSNGLQPFVLGYFDNPTPGASELMPTRQFGPLVRDVRMEPPAPQVGEDILITAEVVASAQMLKGVQLHYRLMYGPEVTATMFDDGTHGDQRADDGTFTAIVSRDDYVTAWASQNANVDSLDGKMFRFFVATVDDAAHRFRSPYLPDVENIRHHAEYHGTIFADSSDSTLPVLHWFTADPDWHRNGGGNTTRWGAASVFYDGEFYDNISVRVRGSSVINWEKPKYKFEFNPGDDFRYDRNESRVDEFNLQSHYKEKGATTYMGENLAFGFLQNIGVPSPNTIHFQMRQNGDFHSLASFVEQIDATFLERNGLDPYGPMYKANSPAARSTLARNPTAADYQKVTRKHEPWDDFKLFTDEINSRSNGRRTTYLYDHVNLAQVINVMAGNTILTNHDRLTKNYYMYLDPATDQWNRFPWDMDQAFALRTDSNFSSVLYGDSEHPQATGQPQYQNHLLDAILDHRPTREMYLRRLRTLFDDFLATRYFERKASELFKSIKQDADRDHAKWRAGRIEDGIARLGNNLEFRRHQLANDPLVPRSLLEFEETVRLSGDGIGKVYVPFGPDDATNWWKVAADDSGAGWMTSVGGIGYETGSGYEPYIGELFVDSERTKSIGLIEAMDRNQDDVADTTSIYSRHYFDIDDIESVDRIELRMRFDDGFIAFLNGKEIARENYQGDVSWHKTATRNHEADAAWESIPIALGSDNEPLQKGRNVLAIQTVNKQANSPDFLIQPTIVTMKRVSVMHNLTFGEMELLAERPMENFISIKNNEEFAVDISGWSLNVMGQPFLPGTVIPSHSQLFVASDIRAFRQRSNGPSGRQRLFVQEGLDLQAPSELVLRNNAGKIVAKASIFRKGDLNRDGQLTSSDIDYFCERWRSGVHEPRLDLNADTQVDAADHAFLVTRIFDSNFGDANLDGLFRTDDLVLVFQAGEYENTIGNDSGWADGDWNCDGEFDSSDLVLAFQKGFDG